MKIGRSYRVIPGYPAGSVRAPRRIQAVDPVGERPSDDDVAEVEDEEPSAHEQRSPDDTLDARDEVSVDIELVELSQRDTGRRRSYPDSEDEEEEERGTLDVVV